MTINSLEFIIFSAIVCILYFAVPKKIKWIILLIASYLFYFINSGKLAVFLIITTISIYFSALKMGKIDEETSKKVKELEKSERKKENAQAQRKKKIIIAITILINFAILVILKYSNFITGNFNNILNLLHINIQIPALKIILPLGISYYTLQATSYIIDVYRKKYKPDTNFGKVALFLSFFPQITEGPIGRYNLLADQLYEPKKFSYKNLTFGLQLIVWGYFKKMVIADRAALFVDPIFNSYADYSGIIVIIAIILYTLQIYAEFSGCIDIVRGISQVLGIHLEQNFKRPFFSKSVEEFWRRWHITLGTWIKDYIFYSVSFSKICTKLVNFTRKIFKGHIGKIIPGIFALFFVWLFNGIWHGANWKYIFYGLYYYIIMTIGMIFEPLTSIIIKKLRIKTNVFSYKLWQVVRTFVLVNIGMLIFRASHLKVALDMFKSCFTVNNIDMIFNGKILNLGLNASDMFVLIFGILIMIIVSIFQEKGYSIRESVAKQNLVFRWILYYGAFFAILIWGIYGVGYNASSFIYGQF